jgi:hypothetical protein
MSIYYINQNIKTINREIYEIKNSDILSNFSGNEDIIKSNIDKELLKSNAEILKLTQIIEKLGIDNSLSIEFREKLYYETANKNTLTNKHTIISNKILKIKEQYNIRNELLNVKYKNLNDFYVKKFYFYETNIRNDIKRYNDLLNNPEDFFRISAIEISEIEVKIKEYEIKSNKLNLELSSLNNAKNTLIKLNNDDYTSIINSLIVSIKDVTIKFREIDNELNFFKSEMKIKIKSVEDFRQSKDFGLNCQFLHCYYKQLGCGYDENHLDSEFTLFINENAIKLNLLTENDSYIFKQIYKLCFVLKKNVATNCCSKDIITCSFCNAELDIKFNECSYCRM